MTNQHNSVKQTISDTIRGNNKRGNNSVKLIPSLLVTSLSVAFLAFAQQASAAEVVFIESLAEPVKPSNLTQSKLSEPTPSDSSTLDLDSFDLESSQVVIEQNRRIISMDDAQNKAQQRQNRSSIYTNNPNSQQQTYQSDAIDGSNANSDAITQKLNQIITTEQNTVTNVPNTNSASSTVKPQQNQPTYRISDEAGQVVGTTNVNVNQLGTPSQDIQVVKPQTAVVEQAVNVEQAPTIEEINEQVDEEISEQQQSDIDDGQAMTSSSIDASDSSAIKSIENKNGKIYTTTNLSHYAEQVNNAVWTPNMRKNTAMTVKLQTLLDWNHASPGPIDGGWGMNSKKALTNFQKMRNLKATGKMDAATWKALTKNVNLDNPVLVQYTLTQDDVNTKFARTPSGSEAKSKMKGLYYQNMIEMLGERFHMDVRYLEKLNKGKKFKAGETITVINVGDPLKATIDRVVANKASETLYAYNGNKLVAAYPTTVGSSNTPSPHGTYKIVNKVKMPWYKATIEKGDKKEVFMLPPGPNNPVGVVWMGLSKPSYGLHGSPVPEGISRQASHGCIRLTNWDVLEVYANIKKGAKVELQ